MARKPVIAGNWKMHMTVPEALELARGIIPGCANNADVEVVLGPPFTALHAVKEAIRDAGIGLAAQNMHYELKGAFTGEVSAPMLKDAGCTHVIIGHSERRQYFCETDGAVQRKLAVALAFGLVPIVCVGETLSQRERGETFSVIEGQLAQGLKDIGQDKAGGIIIAYEPVWAIGTGKTATPGQAQEVHAFIRNWLGKSFGEGVSSRVRIQYGGSVKPGNIKELMAQEDVDGALVGGACLTADSFTALVNYGKV